MRAVNASPIDPLVLIPGIQGRWEWMRPAVAALSARRPVLTFSLGDVRGDRIFDRWVDHVDALLDRHGARRAIVAGVSFGGLAAVRYAARRRDRTAALVLVSAPSPRLQLDPQSVRFVARPRLALPFFAMRSVRRMAPELMASYASWPARVAGTAAHVARVLRFPASTPRMAEWVRAWQRLDLVADCRAVTAPTLVLTGEPRLDRVVPVASSLDYLTLIPGARHVVLPRTGHLGLIVKPREFAAAIDAFLS